MNIGNARNLCEKLERHSFSSYISFKDFKLSRLFMLFAFAACLVCGNFRLTFHSLREANSLCQQQQAPSTIAVSHNKVSDSLHFPFLCLANYYRARAFSEERES